MVKIPACAPFTNNSRAPVTWKIVIIFKFRKAELTHFSPVSHFYTS